MATTVHKNLTGADLHEPKGADTALAGQIYVSDGAGSGTWVLATSVILNTSFTTGDLKPTHKTTADSTWILWSDGSIGDGSSTATIRANADTSALFTLYWNGYSNTLCPVSGGRGVSAAADFAAHKRLTLPVGAGRVLGLAGAGSGLTSRTVGTSTGTETVTLTAAQIPALTSAGNNTITVDSLVSVPSQVAPNQAVDSTGAGGVAWTTTPTYGLIVSQRVNTITVTTTTALGGSHSNMQPSAFINVMVKL